MEVVDVVVGERSLYFPYLMHPKRPLEREALLFVLRFVLLGKLSWIIFPLPQHAVVPSNEGFFF